MNFLGQTSDGWQREFIDITDASMDLIEGLRDTIRTIACLACNEQGCSCCAGAGFHIVVCLT